MDNRVTSGDFHSTNLPLLDRNEMTFDLNSGDTPGSSEPAWKLSSTHRLLKNIIARKPTSFWVFLFLSTCAMLIAFPASTLLSRLYYVNGGKSRWLLSWIAVAGWPLTAAFLIPFYFMEEARPTKLTCQLTLSYALLGLLSFVDNMLYAYAYAYLPASTASLLSSSAVVFTAIFAYFIVNKKLNISTLNAIVIIAAASVLIGLDSDSDIPSGVNHGQYIAGFLWDILGSALHGLIFALSELLFIKLLGRSSFHVVLEQQLMVSLFGCIFTTIGVVVNDDFRAMRSEAATFKDGPVSYYMVLFWGAVTFQLGVLGSVAVLYLTSTLLAGVLNAARVPITSIAAVIFFHDSMDGFKILSLLLTLWGFASYIHGSTLEVKQKQDTDVP
eukprot:TRINITY_DN5004_c0_g1_i1.p1 TRINITY_DN5004_c0_g1~~TRINITY_DN5004_c0_g1_i1.p1  ORF type:complete len:385 (-),score=46.12 TRINITY_DN5004_c0_g1_i1:175-1329(-)